MSLTIDLSPQAQHRLDEEVAHRGQTAPDCARAILEQQLLGSGRQSQIERNQAAIALLDQWLEEDPPEGPDPDPPIEVPALTLREVRLD